MSHLGQRISALIDGELSDSERDRVLTHIAGCDACRQEAVALRALKHRMHSLGEAMVDAALTGRLMAMAMPPDGRPWTARPPWRPRAAFPAARMLTAGLLASAVAGLGAAAFFAGGEQQAPGPRVTPAVGTFLVQHAIVTGDVPVTPARRDLQPRRRRRQRGPGRRGRCPGRRGGQRRGRRVGSGCGELSGSCWPPVRQPRVRQHPLGGRPVSPGRSAGGHQPRAAQLAASQPRAAQRPAGPRG